jgi:hypothetical protein
MVYSVHIYRYQLRPSRISAQAASHPPCGAALHRSCGLRPPHTESKLLCGTDVHQSRERRVWLVSDRSILDQKGRRIFPHSFPHSKILTPCWGGFWIPAPSVQVAQMID